MHFGLPSLVGFLSASPPVFAATLTFVASVDGKATGRTDDAIIALYKTKTDNEDESISIDLENGDSHGPSCTTLPAVSGYPHLTVPMGMVEGLPIGLSFMGTAWSETNLLRLGQGFEMVRGEFARYRRSQ